MDKEARDEVQRLFHEAIERPPEARRAFLAAACGASGPLRDQVEKLLLAHGGAGEFLANPTVDFDALSASAVDEPVAGQVVPLPGTRVGRYKVLEVLGEGGFGVVYQAEQEHPVRRKVALKVIKVGMDTKEVIARFEAERQALALMDHPNIAKVFDGGATESGRPYFIMELVRGVPMTQYADLNQLSTPERIGLFVQVCSAVQHAHQKGVIHRDLKPSNILVTLHDGEPVPKVIDFGIAKATNARLTERTLFTRHRQLVGTPAYMSPEQAEMSGLDVDTRSDIYSLGVILYELLTGTTPFDARSLLEAGYAEIQRIIRETEPPKPSTRVSTMAQEGRSAVARNRRAEPRRLSILLRGDLDWIVMKSLEKDRTRRYDSAAALARDLERHLAFEPVEAGRPSGAYRMARFVRRNRLVLATSAVVAGALIAGLLLAVWGFMRARDEADLARTAEATAVAAAGEARRAAERELIAHTATKKEADKARRVVDLFRQLFATADPHESLGEDYPVRKVLDDFGRKFQRELESHPEVEATLRGVMGRAYLGLGLFDPAAKNLSRALELGERPGVVEESDAFELRLELGRAQTELGEGAAHENLKQLVEVLTAHPRFGPAHQLTLRSMAALAHQRFPHSNMPDEALDLYRRVIDAARKLEAPGNQLALLGGNGLSQVYRDRDPGAAEAILRETLDAGRKTLGEAHPYTLRSAYLLAELYSLVGGTRKGLDVLEESIGAMRSGWGGEHPDTLKALAKLATLLQRSQRGSEAEKVAAEVREALARHRERKDSKTFDAHLALVEYCLAARRWEAAEPLLERVIADSREVFGPGNIRELEAGNSLGIILLAMNQLARAEKTLTAVLEPLRRDAPDHPLTRGCIFNLANVYVNQGRFEAAEPLLRELYHSASWEEGKIISQDNFQQLNSFAHVLSELGRKEEAFQISTQWLEFARRQLEPNDPDLASALIGQSVSLLRLHRGGEAESLARETLEIRRKILPSGHWSTANAESILGECLMVEEKLAEAEPLLLSGYRGLRQASEKTLVQTKNAVLRLIALAERQKPPGDVEKWRRELKDLEARIARLSEPEQLETKR